MTAAKTLVALGAACLACCAVPWVGPLLAAIGLAGIGAAALGWTAALAVPVIAVAVIVLRRRTARSCDTGVLTNRTAVVVALTSAPLLGT